MMPDLEIQAELLNEDNEEVDFDPYTPEEDIQGIANELFHHIDTEDDEPEPDREPETSELEPEPEPEITADDDSNSESKTESDVSNEEIDKLGDLDFSMPSLEQVKLPETELKTEAKDNEPLSEIPKSSPYDEAIPVVAGGDKKLHKRSVPKVVIGVSCAVLVAAVGSMATNGTISTKTQQASPIEEEKAFEPPPMAPESDEGNLQARLSSEELAREIEGRKKAREAQAAAEKATADEAKHNQRIGVPSTGSNTPPPPTRIVYPSSSRNFYRSPPANPSPAPIRRAKSSSIASNRVVPPRLPVSQVPPVQPVSVPRNPGTPAQRSAVLDKSQEAPEMLSFGSMPDDNFQSGSDSFQNSSSELGYQQVVNRSQPVPFPNSSDNLLAQQQEAFLSGRKQTQIMAGQSIDGSIEGQYLAATDTEFLVRSTSSVLGLESGSLLRAKVLAMSGKYINAEVVAIFSSGGIELPIPPGAITLSSSRGKLLKASSNKGFFDSAVGKGLLGFGSGAVDQFVSRNESFSSNQYGSNFTRGAGSKDLTSVLGSGLKSFADPILQNPGPGQTALTINPGAVKLNINSSFTITQ